MTICVVIATSSSDIYFFAIPVLLLLPSFFFFFLFFILFWLARNASPGGGVQPAAPQDMVVDCWWGYITGSNWGQHADVCMAIATAMTDDGLTIAFEDTVGYERLPFYLFIFGSGGIID